MSDRAVAIERRTGDGGSGAKWVRPVLGGLSPGGARARLTILIFHRVRDRPDDLYPGEAHAAAFRERMLWVRDTFNVLPLGDAVAALERRSLPARALAITFDDGYADNATVALPILLELGLHATFFVATRYLNGGRMWNDTVIEAMRRATAPMLDLSPLGLTASPIGSPLERRALIARALGHLKYLPQSEREARVDRFAAASGLEPAEALMMTSDQLRSLANSGMDIGAHTVSHPILARLDDADARTEMANGRDELEAIVRRPVVLFAYPNGKPGVDYTAVHARIARDLGFAAAFSTAAGAARAGDSIYQLPRFTPWDRTATGWGARLVRNLFTKVQTATG